MTHPTDPIRALCAEMVLNWDNAEGDQDFLSLADTMDRARTLLNQPPEPAEGPIPVEELRAGWNQQADEFNQWESLDLGEQLAWAQARAVARHGNRRPEPAEGPSDEELCAFFEENDWNYISPETFCDISRSVLDTFGCPDPRPAPIAVADVRYEYNVFDSETDEWAASGEAQTLEDAIREGNHYLAQYNEDGPHRLELREVRVLPAPPIAAELGEAQP